MSKRDPFPHDYPSLLETLEKLAAGLVTHGTALGFSATEVTAAGSDAGYARYVHTHHQRLRSSSTQWSDWKEVLFNGGEGTTTAVPAFPAAPATSVAAVLPGIVLRARANARRAKASPNYSVAIGKALGIEGAEEAAPDLDTLQPELAAELTGGKVKVGWTRGAADALEIHVDRGDGKGFTFLAIDTVPDYVDTEAIPAAPAVWKYKAIYRKADERIGQWSAVVSVGLGG
jgi:hypothetical protein